MTGPVKETDLLQEIKFWSQCSVVDLALYLLFEI
jgi:hypothetical protein